MEASQIVHAQMPLKLIKEAKNFAAKRDMTMSQVLRLALTTYLIGEKKKK